MSDCNAVQCSDQMTCSCGNVWDMNDPYPPECKTELAMLAVAPAVQVEPTDNELLEWAEDEQFFLFCDEDEFLQIARSVIHKYGRKGTVDVLAAPQPAEQQPISHDWDDQGKCRRCGGRDWYASATCTPKQQPSPPTASKGGEL